MRKKVSMREAVKIKSFPNGIALYLNGELPFEKVLEEVGYKFSAARNFFGSASMALSIEGREVTDMEELMILDAIRENSNLNILCIVGHDDEVNQNYIKALAEIEERPAENTDGQFFKGDLKNREVVETPNSIIILGDIYPGSTVISARNIIILGALHGKAYAGGDGQEGAYIAAFEMEPERLKIGDFKYLPGTRQTKWGIRPKVRPKIAYVKNNRIVMETLTKDFLNTF
jgi:septum site-determining protein MinC